MLRTIEDFLNGWQYESQKTLDTIRGLTGDSLGQSIVPGFRPLGRLAWHITQTCSELPSQAGLGVSAVAEDAPVPAAAAEIADAYEKSAAAAASAVKGQWTDDQLEDEVPMYGDQWKKGFILSALMAHQARHRGQMTVRMRYGGSERAGHLRPGHGGMGGPRHACAGISQAQKGTLSKTGGRPAPLRGRPYLSNLSGIRKSKSQPRFAWVTCSRNSLP